MKTVFHVMCPIGWHLFCIAHVKVHVFEVLKIYKLKLEELVLNYVFCTICGVLNVQFPAPIPRPGNDETLHPRVGISNPKIITILANGSEFQPRFGGRVGVQ